LTSSRLVSPSLPLSSKANFASSIFFFLLPPPPFD
jgi:hypothetical protein